MKLVADANVLLASVLGGRAKTILEHPEIEEVLTPAVTLAEVQEYAPILAQKKGLARDVILLAVPALPISVVEQAVYTPAMPRARKLIAKPDPDDVEVLALALHLTLPRWSNDNDFEETGIELYATAELLKRLSQLRE